MQFLEYVRERIGELELTPVLEKSLRSAYEAEESDPKVKKVAASSEPDVKPTRVLDFRKTAQQLLLDTGLRPSTAKGETDHVRAATATIERALRAANEAGRQNGPTPMRVSEMAALIRTAYLTHGCQAAIHDPLEKSGDYTSWMAAARAALGIKEEGQELYADWCAAGPGLTTPWRFLSDGEKLRWQELERHTEQKSR